MRGTTIERIATLAVGAIALGVLFVVGMKYIFPVLSPFIIAWIVAFSVREPSRRVAKRLHLSERVVRPILAIFLTLLIFSLLFLIGWQITERLWEMLGNIGRGDGPIYELLVRLTDGNLLIPADRIDPELAERIKDAVGSTVSGILSDVASLVTGWAGALPNALLYLVVTVISLIYFSIDLERINITVRRILPESLGGMLSRIRAELFGIAGRFIVSYLKLMMITFAVTCTGLLILRVEGAFVLALVMALFDFLPIIGVGTVLVPWSVIELAVGNFRLGIGLLVLFVVNSVLRELLEPRIVGKSLNLHPLLMLVLIYAGYALFGIEGLFMIPVSAVVIGYLFKKDDTAEVEKPSVRE